MSFLVLFLILNYIISPYIIYSNCINYRYYKKSHLKHLFLNYCYFLQLLGIIFKFNVDMYIHLFTI